MVSSRRLPYKRHLSANEVDGLLAGFKPKGMDDKWFYFAEGQVIHLHRSWTGQEIYSLRIDRRADGKGELAEVRCNDDYPNDDGAVWTPNLRSTRSCRSTTATDGLRSASRSTARVSSRSRWLASAAEGTLREQHSGHERSPAAIRLPATCGGRCRTGVRAEGTAPPQGPGAGTRPVRRRIGHRLGAMASTVQTGFGVVAHGRLTELAPGT